MGEFEVGIEADVADLRRTVEELVRVVSSDGEAIERTWTDRFGTADPGTANLARYLALRRHDLRSLQRALTARGLSSLGRLESRVMPTLQAVAAALAALDGEAGAELPPPGSLFEGEARLEAATAALFGPPPPTRRGRIMVTLPGESAGTGYAADLVRHGMDVARINCAHDDPAVWRRLAGDVRRAAADTGRTVRIIMDIAGPKIRTGAVAMLEKRKVEVGDRIRLVAGPEPRPDADAPFSATASLPEVVTSLELGHRVLYDDGRMEATVVGHSGREAVLRVVKVKTGGAKLKPEKGLNLPNSALGLRPLTFKDVADLDTVAELADMVGYSFVSRASDIDLLDEALDRLGGPERPLGIVAKIERPEAIRNLPDLIARLSGRRPLGVMIARGDLAAEIGFERLAEMQEEILWICEAAAVPVIWATQVLEGLVKDGVPSRGEMTDAAMATRAECVMLNKGPCAAAAIEVLAGLFTRMDGHLFKKSPRLRALRSW